MSFTAPEVSVDESTGRPSKGGEWVLQNLVRPWVSVAFRPTLSGTENLPASGPFLLVANHSAGLGLAEIACFASLYYQRFGCERPLAGFAHPLSFKRWPLTAVMRALGTIPSTYQAAKATVDYGVPVLVFPGGDYETLRPIWQAGRVDFGGRKGFLRIAREAGIPIVPMGIRGSHYTVPMLWRSKLLATALVLPRAIGLKRWGVSALGAAGAALALCAPVAWPWRAVLAVAWLTSPLTFAPIVPWKIRFRIGAPMAPEEFFDDDDLGGALGQVEGAIQELMALE